MTVTCFESPCASSLSSYPRTPAVRNKSKHDVKVIRFSLLPLKRTDNDFESVLYKRSRYNDWLQAGQSGDRIPVAARLSMPEYTGPEVSTTYCTMSTG